ncbi:MAG: histidine phosphatase family protein [Pseudomonadota bacterium]
MATNIKHICLALFGFALAACSTAPEVQTTTVYLVRHAEKVTGEALSALPDANDPPLTTAGAQRAEQLAELLVEADIEKIWSTDTIRTRDTAQPLADRLGLPIEIYDASDLSAFAQILKDDPMTALIVGHSNTTPNLAESLGANPGAPIVEATEYNRLYVIDLASGDGEIQRFGAD